MITHGIAYTAHSIATRRHVFTNELWQMDHDGDSLRAELFFAILWNMMTFQFDTQWLVYFCFTGERSINTKWKRRWRKKKMPKVKRQNRNSRAFISWTVIPYALFAGHVVIFSIFIFPWSIRLLCWNYCHFIIRLGPTDTTNRMGWKRRRWREKREKNLHTMYLLGFP